MMLFLSSRRAIQVSMTFVLGLVFLATDLPSGLQTPAYAGEMTLAQASGKKKKGGRKKKGRNARGKGRNKAGGEPAAGDGAEGAAAPAGKPGQGPGLLFHLGMDTIKWKDTGDASIEQGGFGIGLGGVFGLGVADCCSLGLGGGYHTVSYVGSNEFADLTTKVDSLFLDVDFGFWATPAFSIGFVFDYYIFMSGSVAVTFKESEFTDGGDETVDLAEASRTDMGLRLKFLATPNLPLGLDLATISGSFKSDAEGSETVNFSGTSIRFFLEYLF